MTRGSSAPSLLVSWQGRQRVVLQSLTVGLTAIIIIICQSIPSALAWTGGSSSFRNNAWLSSSSSSSSFSWHRKSSSNSHGAAPPMTMYFDDVSRNHWIQWNPSSSSSSSPDAANWEQSQNNIDEKKEEDKDVLIQRILNGYDADSASQLSNREVQEETKLWTEKAGVVGTFFGDELYADLLGVNVARRSSSRSSSSTSSGKKTKTTTTTKTTSLVHSLADFWQSVAAVIDLHTDKEVSPPRWIPHPRYANQNLTALTAFSSYKVNATDGDLYGRDGVLGDRIHMIVLPDCPDLYEYQIFTTLLAAVEFSKDLCVHVGRHFTLTAFHPHFKNSPKLFSPERHSPFPTVGLQLKPLWDKMGKDADLPLGGTIAAARNKPREQSKKDDSGKILPHPDDAPEDEEIGALADARIRNLDETRAHFEVLFNSAAAVETGDDSPSAAPSSKPSSSASRITASAAALAQLPVNASSIPDKEGKELAKTFIQERQRRRSDYPPEMVRQLIAVWMDEQRYADASKDELNPALEFMDTIDGYKVCVQKMGELVYADIWQSVRDLYEKGLQADAEETAVKAVGKDDKMVQQTSSSTSRFNFSKWMHSFSSESVKNENDKDDATEEMPTVISTLFIATKFNTYNAQSFKRFAITINAALKRITGGRMFIEVFHPEYVGGKGYNHALRRSPFPMIQICYLVQGETPVPEIKDKMEKNKE